jgi:hypothetical protein
MADRDEIKKLRSDLDYLLNMAGKIGRRIDELERESKLESLADAAATRRTEEPPPLPMTFGPPKVETPAFVRVEPERPREKKEEIRFTPAPEAVEADSREREAFVGSGSAQIQSARKPKGPGLEIAFATYWLPRIGMGIIGIAAVFFLAYAAQFGTPTTRVALGYAVAVAFLISGKFLERSRQQFGRVLFGGGFALLYFVTFAAHYIEYSKVIESKPLGIALLLLVVAAWAAVAQIRQSRIMATMATLLAHLTMGLSIFASQEIARPSALGLVVLSLGSAFFLLRNRWYGVAFVGIAGCYVNHALWMWKVRGGGSLPEFFIAMSFLAAYFLVFALAELFCKDEVRLRSIPFWFRTTFVTLNSAGLLGLGTVTVMGTALAQDHQDLFRYIVAIALFEIGFAYLHLRKGDPLYNVYITKAVAVATLGLSATFGKDAFTASLAVETVVLLYSARRSGMWVTRALALLVAAIAVVHGLSRLATLSSLLIPPIAYTDPDFSKVAFESGLALLSLFASAVLYQRTDWTQRQPFPAFLVPRNELSDSASGPYSHDLQSTLSSPALLYASGGCILSFVYSLTIIHDGHRLLALALCALLLTASAAGFRANALGIAALIHVILGLFFGPLEIIRDQYSLAIGLIAVGSLVCVAVSSESFLVSKFSGLNLFGERGVSYLLYLAASWLLAMVLWNTIAEPKAVLAILAAAVVAVAAVSVLNPNPLAWCATGLSSVAAFRWLTGGHDDTMYWLWHAGMWSVFLCALGTDRFFNALPRAIDKGAQSKILIVAAWLPLMTYASELAPEPWQPAWSTAISFFFAAYGFAFSSTAAFVISIVGTVYSSLFVFRNAYAPGLERHQLANTCGFLLNALYWGICERGVARSNLKAHAQWKDVTTKVLPFLVSGLLVFLIERIWELSDQYLTVSWAVLALGVFALALYLRQRFYRYASLCIFLLAMLRAFLYDTSKLEGLQRAASFAGLGLLLLLVAYAYLWAMKIIAPDQEDNNDEPK